jgi:outer membrane protein assembly factor BamB
MSVERVIRGVVAVAASAVVAGGAVYYGLKLNAHPAPVAAGPAAAAPAEPAKPAAEPAKPEAATPEPAKPEAKPEPKAEAPKPTDPPKPEPVKTAATVQAEPTAPAAPAGKPTAPLPMFGGGPERNMVNLVAKNIPEKPEPDGESMLFKADLGSRAYGGPTVGHGVVLCGTNNERPRNPRDAKKNADGEIEPIDRGVLMCFDAKTGKFKWQAVHNKLESGQVNDWPKEGVCATPTIDGNRAYYVSNRCAVVCVDLNGFADGNQGFQGERYKDPTDADIIWEFDMMREVGVFPHNMSAGCPLIVGDVLYTVTANGVDEGHINIPAPDAPSFIALNKHTGKLLWRNSLPGKNIMHGQWSNPVYAVFGGKPQVIFPGGDGWIYAFTPDTGDMIWKFDANPKDSKYELGGTGTRSDFVGTPVLHDGKLFIGTGQDPEHFTGIAHFYCIDPAGKRGDISPVLEDRSAAGKVGSKPNPNSAVVWHFGGEERRKYMPADFKFGRTMSTACVVDGLVYISELRGILYCLDAKTGKKYWQYDTKGSIWGSPYYADGKVYLATEAGDLFVFKHDPKPPAIDELDNPDAKDEKDFRAKMLAKRKEVEKAVLLNKIEFDAPIRSTPVVADDTLYVMTEKTLFAFKKK